MKLQNTPNLQLNVSKQETPNKNNSNVAFGGGELFTTALNYAQTNQAVGASLVDVGSMCIPRTAVDYTRSPEAGTETAIREFSCNLNNALLGTYGVGAAILFASAFNNDYGVRADKMFVDEDSLDILTELRNEIGDISDEKNLTKYISSIMDNTHGFNPNSTSDKACNGWIPMADEEKSQFIEKFVSEFKSNSTVPKKDDVIKKTKEVLKALLVRGTESEDKIKIELGNKPVVSAKDFVDNLYKLTDAFKNENVFDKESGLIKEDFIKGLKKIHTKTAYLGLATCMAVGASVQPINMYLTKKKTGKEGFVGVEGREPDKSNSFKVLKTGIAALAVYGTLASITNSFKIGFKDVLGKVKFKGFVPTINQFKIVYGATIASRLLSSRDKNELRETSFKDSLGFANWLILGGFASNLAAVAIEKFNDNKVKLLKHNDVENGTKMPKWITGSIESREEALQKALKISGISIIKEGGKALSFKEMLKKIPDIEMKNPDVAKALKSKLKYLTAIQFIGYLWSGLALGIGIPKLNIAITNALEKKSKMQKSDRKEVKQEQVAA